MLAALLIPGTVWCTWSQMPTWTESFSSFPRSRSEPGRYPWSGRRKMLNRSQRWASAIYYLFAFQGWWSMIVTSFSTYVCSVFVRLKPGSFRVWSLLSFLWADVNNLIYELSWCYRNVHLCSRGTDLYVSADVQWSVCRCERREENMLHFFSFLGMLPNYDLRFFGHLCIITLSHMHMGKLSIAVDVIYKTATEQILKKYYQYNFIELLFNFFTTFPNVLYFPCWAY